MRVHKIAEDQEIVDGVLMYEGKIEIIAEVLKFAEAEARYTGGIEIAVRVHENEEDLEEAAEVQCEEIEIVVTRALRCEGGIEIAGVRPGEEAGTPARVPNRTGDLEIAVELQTRLEEVKETVEVLIALGNSKEAPPPEGMCVVLSTKARLMYEFVQITVVIGLGMNYS